MSRWQGLAVLTLLVAVLCIGLPEARGALSSSVSGDGGYDFQSMIFQLPQDTTATGIEIGFNYTLTVDTNPLDWGQASVNLYVNQMPIATPSYSSQGTMSPPWPSEGSYLFYVALSDFTLNDGFYVLPIDLETISAGSGSASAEVTASAVPVPSTALLLCSALGGIFAFRDRIRHWVA